ncbi:exosortase-associated EpsI family protein [Roseiconus nitratireducens]|uniref:exosortase-associated EpsI family protein n=1 Tax=Roseiconus nitratireducens TaxID=2605748 RepID=UPI001F30C485|nr:exosortase-associated EpsI family protein [Roseiconus nitratireducens]
MSDSNSKPSFNSRRYAVVALLVLIVMSGVVHGYLDGRWSLAEDKTRLGEQLLEIPAEFGDWQLVEEGELADSAAKMLRCYGSVVRVYRHQPTGSIINVAVLYGPRGPIAVHTPEICYSSEGTEQAGKARVETVTTDGQQHHFWSVQFLEDGNPDPSLEVWYGWSNGDAFTAADHPRFWPTADLYKIQLAGPVAQSDFNACKSFLASLLPHLEPLIH